MGQREEPLIRMGGVLTDACETELRLLPVPDQRERLVLAVARHRHRRALAQNSLLALAALSVIGFLFLRPGPLSFEVGEQGVGKEEAFIGSQSNSLPLKFSDGTRITLAPKTQARVSKLDQAGARVILEQGHLTAKVVHRKSARWTLVAGPFEILVTGTEFDLEWSPASRNLALEMHQGSVWATGPGLGSGRALQSGLVLRYSGQREDTHAASPDVMGDDRPSSMREAGATPAATGAASTPSPGASVAAQATPTGGALESLRAMAQERDYRGVLHLVDKEGLTELLSRGRASDLMSIADAARFSGRGNLAREALLTLRKRFPHDSRAASAAFLLGRTLFEQSQDIAGAAEWFSTYLAQQPRGPLAGEALIRLAECRKRLGDREAARSLAEKYLSQYPAGPQTERAKQLAE
jgi:transmembrane sensor